MTHAKLLTGSPSAMVDITMLDAHVLVLNRLYQPVNVTNVRRAICLMYVGAARALDSQFRLFDFPSWAALSADFGSDTIRAVHGQLLVPRIVVLQVYERIPKGRIRFSRHNIFVRDNHTCQYCNTLMTRRHLNLDHVVPRSQGGKTNWENVVTSCIPCNFRKGCRTPEQSGMSLTRPPHKPRWSELVHMPRVRARYDEWLPFLNPVDACYWNTELEHD